MAGSHTLAETERQVQSRLAGSDLDFAAMAVTSTIFRAANAVRNHFERNVLSETGLSWTAFVVLWVTWIWEPIETRQIAAEGGFSKATLTGVLNTLESRGLVKRAKSESDGRLVLVNLTKSGRKLMIELFPAFNKQEAEVSAMLSANQRADLAEMLSSITTFTESTEE